MRAKVETRVGVFVLTALGILFYVGVYIGAIRLDSDQYVSYTVKFKDVSGLSRKGEVKMAGVKVGWIEKIDLTRGASAHAQAHIIIHKECRLREDAYAAVRQDGVIGPKYIELVPGSAHAAPLLPGSALSEPTVETISVDDLLQKLRAVAGQTESLLRRASSDDFEQVLKSAVRSLKEVCDQATTGLKSVARVTERIEKGQGIIGTLTTDNQCSADIRAAAERLGRYLAAEDLLVFTLDGHSESMFKAADRYRFHENKGYIEIRARSHSDYFFLLQLISSERGFIKRYEICPNYYTHDGTPVDLASLSLTDEARLESAFVKRLEVCKRGAFLFGAQIGKCWGPWSIRVGIFENSAGCGVDFAAPFFGLQGGLLATLEAFDFHGWNRVSDRSPHLKCYSRLFFSKNVYLIAGVDDFVSKQNARFFLGAGISFGGGGCGSVSPRDFSLGPVARRGSFFF